MDLGPPPTIVKKPPQLEISTKKIAQPKVGIPKPVADDEITEDVVLATKEELAEINVSDQVPTGGEPPPALLSNILTLISSSLTSQ